MLPLIFSEIKTARNLYRCGLRHCRNSAADGEASIYQPDTACPDHKRTFGKRIGRVMARSGLTRGEVADIISHQASESERLLLADDVLLNDGSLKSLREKTMLLHAFYSGFSPQTNTRKTQWLNRGKHAFKSNVRPVKRQ